MADAIPQSQSREDRLLDRLHRRLTVVRAARASAAPLLLADGVNSMADAVAVLQMTLAATESHANHVDMMQRAIGVALSKLHEAHSCLATLGKTLEGR